MAQFNLKSFLIDVFDPQAHEQVLVMVDLPHGKIPDHKEWIERREMALDWRDALIEISKERSFEVMPLLTYDATGANGAPLPELGTLGNEKVKISEILPKATLVVAPTEYSATAPLTAYAEKLPRFRGASMPQIKRSMERTGLAADYKRLSALCKKIKEILKPAEAIEIKFSTGHTVTFDTRFRDPVIDDGIIHPSVWGNPLDAVMNLPAGETWKVPYEGEVPGNPSKTAGEIPIIFENELTLFKLKANRVVAIEGDNAFAKEWRAFIELDPMRRNIAEVGFGCNDMADPLGPILEAEKTGFHWAIGLSDHLGGKIGVEHFSKPEYAAHEDFIYAGKNAAKVMLAEAIDSEGNRVAIMKDGLVVV